MPLKKRKQGRPRLPENEGKSPSLTIYFDSEEQRERFKGKARKNCMGIREYAESIIKAKADK